MTPIIHRIVFNSTYFLKPVYDGFYEIFVIKFIFIKKKKKKKEDIGLLDLEIPIYSVRFFRFRLWYIKNPAIRKIENTAMNWSPMNSDTVVTVVAVVVSMLVTVVTFVSGSGVEVPPLQ